jgi:hypothetical protein
MKRCALAILCWLLIGAVLTIVIAWGMKLLRAPGSFSYHRITDFDRAAMWARHADENWPDEPETAPLSFFQCDRKLGVTYCWLDSSLTDEQRAAGLRTSPYKVRGERVGLPMRALHGEVAEFDGTWRKSWMTIRFNLAGREETLPLCPIWPGFVIDIVVVAALLWLVVRGPFVLRAWRRVKGDRCARCGYPFGSSAVCTECGLEVPSAKTRRRVARRLKIAMVVIFLILGVVVNDLVAWACGFLPGAVTTDETTTCSVPPFVDRICREQSANCEEQKRNREEYAGLGYAAVVYRGADEIGQLAPLTYLRVGLPLASVDGAAFWQARFGPRRYAIASPIESRSGFFDFLPLRPVWPGFAINTLLYAFLIWLIARRLRALGRRLRAGKCAG